MNSEALIEKLQEYRNPIVIFCIGILIGSTFYFKDLKLLFLFGICLTFLFLFLLLKNKKILLLTFATIFGYLYCFYYFKFFNINLDNLLNQKNIYIGEVLSSGGESGQYYRKYFVKLKSSLNSKVLLLTSHYEEYSPGDIIQITGTLKRPKNALLPGLFDERKYLFTRSVNYILKEEPGSIVFLDESKGTIFQKKIIDVRKKIISINSKYLLPDNLAIVNGIVLGSKASKLPDYLKDKIQSLGLSHITSASGFNISILAFCIFYLFRLFQKNKLLPTIISIFAVLFYSCIADFSASIIRAAVFTIFVLIGNLFDKKLKVLPGVSFIVLLFFLFNPVNLLDIGLQLSILAFLGLILFLSEGENGSKNENQNNFLSSLLLQSFFAQIMVMPLIVFYFHNIQILGLVSNLLAVPLASFILVIGLISILLGFIPKLELLNHLCCYLLKILSDLFLGWINFLDKTPLKQIFLPNLNFYLLILIYIFIIFSLCSLFISSCRKKYLAFLIVFSLLFFSVYRLTDTSEGKNVKIFSLAKYNQDAILVICPKEKPVLLSNRLDYNEHRALIDFLRLNNLGTDYNFYYINENHHINSSCIKDEKSKINIQYKDFSFDIIKNYKNKISTSSDYLKLPILMKNDPPFSKVFLSFDFNLYFYCLFIVFAVYFFI